MPAVRAFLGVFAVLFLGAAVLFLLMLARRRLELWRLSGWPEVPARLEEVRLEAHGVDEARVVVRFGFEVEGRRWTGETLEQALREPVERARAEEWMRELKALPRPVVRVNPKDPRESVLLTDLVPPPVVLVVMAGVFFGLAAVFAVVAVVLG